MSTTGFEKRIAAEVPDLSRGQVKKLAYKLAKRAAAMQEEFDFYTALKVLGVSPDPTALRAVQNMEAAA